MDGRLWNILHMTQKGIKAPMEYVKNDMQGKISSMKYIQLVKGYIWSDRTNIFADEAYLLRYQTLPHIKNNFY
jgi:hypothetical protein